MEVVKERGISFTVARTWPGQDRGFERKLKNSGGLSRYCGVCKAEGTIPASRRRTRAEAPVAPPAPATGPDYAEAEERAGEEFGKRSGLHSQMEGLARKNFRNNPPVFDKDSPDARFIYADGFVQQSHEPHYDIAQESLPKDRLTPWPEDDTEACCDAEIADTAIFMRETGAIRVADNGRDSITFHLEAPPSTQQVRRMAQMSRGKGVHWLLWTEAYGEGSFADMQRAMRGGTASNEKTAEALAKDIMEGYDSFLWAIWDGKVLFTQEYLPHASWFRNMHIPCSGPDFDRIPRGRAWVNIENEEVILFTEAGSGDITGGRDFAFAPEPVVQAMKRRFPQVKDFEFVDKVDTPCYRRFAAAKLPQGVLITVKRERLSGGSDWYVGHIWKDYQYVTHCPVVSETPS